METRIALAGDVMIARGIDQIMPRSVNPELREPAVRDARDYISLAEEENGPIPRNVDPDYVWGDALETLRAFDPHATVLNLETSLTTESTFDPSKRIHYRAHPANARAAAVPPRAVCTLANNHVLDFGVPGLRETLETLGREEIPGCGAGATADAACAPAVRSYNDASVAVLSCCVGDSGVPPDWTAGGAGDGVYRLRRLDGAAVAEIGRLMAEAGDARTVRVVSIHWGGNWGYTVEAEKREFARALVDAGAAHVVHGHSSHHPRPFEIHRHAPILYGCGDLINDYEGIRGHGGYRPELAAVYLVSLDPARTPPARLRVAPFRRRRFRLERADEHDARWLARKLTEENRRVDGPALRATPDGLFIAG